MSDDVFITVRFNIGPFDHLIDDETLNSEYGGDLATWVAELIREDGICSLLDDNGELLAVEHNGERTVFTLDDVALILDKLYYREGGWMVEQQYIKGEVLAELSRLHCRALALPLAPGKDD